MPSDSKDAAPGRGEEESLAGDSRARGRDGDLGRRAGDRVMVTGARGFIGRAVIERLLAGGWPVDAVTLAQMAEKAHPSPDLAWHQVDLLDSGAVANYFDRHSPSHLLHLAWAPNRGIYQSPENARWVEASRRLLERFAAAGGRRAVFAGSSAEYDWGKGICRESETPLAGGGAYGEAKRELADIFAEICERETLSGAWARIFFLFGPHEPEGRLVADVARSSLTGRPVRVSEGKQLRDYLFVGDAADALVRILGSDLDGPINVASGTAIRVRDLVERVAGEARVEWGAVETNPDEAPLVVADIGRLERELGWRPPVGLEGGIEQTVAWWRAQLAAAGSR